MSRKPKSLPVIIRYEGEGRATRPDWHLSDVIAFFPTHPGSNTEQSMSCYSSVGQHSSCGMEYISGGTKPATPEQVKAMLKELHGRGYDNLKVVSRASSHHRAERKRALGGR
jgi:hypothetical protein